MINVFKLKPRIRYKFDAANINMGTTESKEVDSTGQVNNNVIINNESLRVHNEDLYLLLAIIAAIKVIEVIHLIYNLVRKVFKRRYGATLPQQISK